MCDFVQNYNRNKFEKQKTPIKIHPKLKLIEF